MMMVMIFVGWSKRTVMSQNVFGSREATDIHTWEVFRYTVSDTRKLEGISHLLFPL